MNSAAPPSSAATRLLVLAPNWLGDAVMTTPLISWLAGLRDPAGRPPEIVLAVREAWLPLFRGDPRITHLVPVARPGEHAGLLGVPRLAARLRSFDCEGAVLGPPSLRAALIARLAGVRVRVGYGGDGRGFLLNPAVPRRLRGERHFVDEMLDLGPVLADRLGWTAAAEDGPGLPALPGCAGEEALDLSGRPLWILGPGATYGEAKTWPPRRVAELAALAIARHGARVLLLGDAAARGAVAGEPALAGVTHGSGSDDAEADVVDLAGRTSLEQAAALLRRATVYVGNDSGLMHLAAALGVPTVGVFGSSNPDWTAPRGRRTAAVTADGFPCRPCYLRRCNQPRFCLDAVAAEDVLAVAESLLDGKAQAPSGKETG